MTLQAGNGHVGLESTGCYRPIAGDREISIQGFEIGKLSHKGAKIDIFTLLASLRILAAVLFACSILDDSPFNCRIY